MFIRKFRSHLILNLFFTTDPQVMRLSDFYIFHIEARILSIDVIKVERFQKYWNLKKTFFLSAAWNFFLHTAVITIKAINLIGLYWISNPTIHKTWPEVICNSKKNLTSSMTFAMSSASLSQNILKNKNKKN